MGADQDAVQGAVVFGVAVISTSLHSTLNTLVCVAIHRNFLLHFGFGLSMTGCRKIMRCFF